MARILVVDDEDQVRSVLSRALQHVGHEVQEAANGKEAVRACEAGRVDVVVTDILMPETEGLAFILKLRQLDPSIRVIAVSGGLQSMDVLDVARRFGAHRTFHKPLDLPEFLDAVQAEVKARQA